MHSLILTWASWILSLLLPAQRAEVRFYNEQFSVSYSAEQLQHQLLSLDEAGVAAYNAQLSSRDWSGLMANLHSRRDAWNLNDWLYFKLVDATVDAIGTGLELNERRLLTAHFMASSGYDVRICYDSTQVYVYARTDEPIFEVPIITEGDARFVNLTAALTPRDGLTRSLKFHPDLLASDGRSFSLSLQRMPRLTPQFQERVLGFAHEGQTYKLHTVTDRSVVAWMNDYPFFAEGRYVETPLSDSVGERLCEELRPLLAGKSELAQLQLLVSFTRNAFVYKEDKRIFGYSRPMIADEVLYYPASDCEDRSALFFALVRDLLNLPVIAIAYNDHLSVAVSCPDIKGRGFLHEGRRYYVCDPTGPAGSTEIGNAPYGYERRRFKVVASYVPSV